MWAEHLPNLREKQHRAASLMEVQASEAEVRAGSSCLKRMKSFTFWPCRLDTRRKCLLSSVICCHWREAIKEKLSASRDNCWASEWMQQIKEDAAYPERQSGKEQRSMCGNCAHLWGKGNGEEGETQRKACRRFGLLQHVLAAACIAWILLLKFCCWDRVLIL